MKDYLIRAGIAAGFTTAGVCLSAHTVLGWAAYAIFFMTAWVCLWAYAHGARL